MAARIRRSGGEVAGDAVAAGREHGLGGEGRPFGVVGGAEPEGFGGLVEGDGHGEGGGRVLLGEGVQLAGEAAGPLGHPGGPVPGGGPAGGVAGGQPEQQALDRGRPAASLRPWVFRPRRRAGPVLRGGCAPAGGGSPRGRGAGPGFAGGTAEPAGRRWPAGAGVLPAAGRVGCRRSVGCAGLVRRRAVRTVGSGARRGRRPAVAASPRCRPLPGRRRPAPVRSPPVAGGRRRSCPTCLSSPGVSSSAMSRTWWPAMEGRQLPRAGPIAAAQSGGIADAPRVAPARAPATAAVVSASRPMLTAVSTDSGSRRRPPRTRRRRGRPPPGPGRSTGSRRSTTAERTARSPGGRPATARGAGSGPSRSPSGTTASAEADHGDRRAAPAIAAATPAATAWPP